ncbi:acyl-CoA reductase [Ramlibacter ginsenosidimutans]|uniref:Acyl-CoA reductase n=1 Tax=Ramlibacter ginsenosidimutans TaxID=502333 RepID=A0A934TT20_9BURK|nr:acyl-CoA reductase [Ramlibacter ginsenosidimutans]MBK6006232.1 acyl-CoA reductase [Ramlibacter ginsenosidimutans]
MNTELFTAGHLPGLAHDEVGWHTLAFGSGAQAVQVQVPVLQPAQLAALAQRVRTAAAQHLKPLAVSQVIAIVDAAIARLLDPADPVRQQAQRLLPVVSGYDADMVRLALTGYLQSFRAPQLHRFVAEDFANPKVLDEFQPAAKGGFVRAFGSDLLVHSWAGNVPALPLWSLVCGLLVKAGNVGKLPSAEPVFATLFARLLAEVHPPLADCLAVVWWKGGDADSARAVFEAADTVLAYGGNAAIAQVRAQVPVTTRFLGYGHKLGFGLVACAALDTQRAQSTARLAAHDVARYEQQGCYSPHLFYVERGARIAPRDFALYLAAELANLQQRYPRRALALEEAAAVSGWRQSAEWQALADAGCELLGAPDAAWAVAYSDTPRPLAPTAGGRCILVCAVDALDDVPALVAPHAAFLQTAGIACEPARLFRLADALGRAGVTRIAALGAMTTPEAGWHHDGRFNLADLVRMVEIESSAERSADRLAPYAQEERS